MKNVFLLYTLSFLSFYSIAKVNQSAITWKANGGRFGDNLLSYSRAKWLSYRYDLPLLCQYFPYCEELSLYENEIIISPEQYEIFSRIIPLTKIFSTSLLKNNVLYVSQWNTSITIDWLDNVFLAELKRNIAPRYEIEKVKIPENVISIAAHVRNGGTFAADTPEEKDRCPLRFLPEEFFIEQVDRIAHMFPDQNIYVFIFTDHPNPSKLVRKFQKALNNERITFDCRKEGNSHKANVLEDFFSMMDFDCLIRPGSHFTRFVQRLGNNKIVIYPESVKEIKGKKVINTIKIKIRPDAQAKWKTKMITIA